MLLQRIKLRNALSYGPSGLELELKPLNVLIGPNGSGKSNLIELIGLLRSAPENLHQTILEGGGVSNWIWRGTSMQTIAEIEANLPYTERRSLTYKLSFYEANQRFQVHSESLCEETTHVNPNPHPYFDSSSGTAILSPSSSNSSRPMQTLRRVPVENNQSVLSQIKGPDYPELTEIGRKLLSIRLFRHWEFGRKSRLRQPQPADLPNNELTEDCSNLGLVLNRIKRDQPSTSDRILNELRQLYDGIEAIDVSVEGNTVQLFLREGQTTIPATRLSDGTLRYMCLVASLCHPNPASLICIEEPELGLHPDLLPGLADLMAEASQKAQLIVTTHSDVLVDRLTEIPESVIVCEKEAGETQLRRLSASELTPWLANYSLGELWTSGQFGGNRW